MIKKRKRKNTVRSGVNNSRIELRVWKQSQRSKIQAVEMNYLRGGCGVNKMDGKSNENVYRKFGTPVFHILYNLI